MSLAAAQEARSLPNERAGRVAASARFGSRRSSSPSRRLSGERDRALRQRSLEASPGFLERAKAALAPPAGTVLHMKWEEGVGSIDRTCVFTRFGPGMVSRGPHEAWVDQEDAAQLGASSWPGADVIRGYVRTGAPSSEMSGEAISTRAGGSSSSRRLSLRSGRSVRAE